MAHTMMKSLTGLTTCNKPLHVYLLLAAGLIPPMTNAHAQETTDPAWRYSVGLVRQDHLQVDLLVAPRWLTADPADNPKNSDIDRDVGVDAGVKVATSFNRYIASLNYTF